MWPYKEKSENRLKLGELTTEYLIVLTLLMSVNSETLDPEIIG